MDGGKNSAGVSGKIIFGLGVADSVDRVADYFLYVHVGVVAMNLAHDDDLAGGAESFYRHSRVLVLAEELVEDGVAYLV